MANAPYAFSILDAAYASGHGGSAAAAKAPAGDENCC